MRILVFVSFVLAGIAFIVNYPAAGTFAGLDALSWLIASAMAALLAVLIGGWLDARVAGARRPPQPPAA